MGSQKKLLIELQCTLGFPTVDLTATRQAVRAYFTIYRECKLLLSMDMVPHAPVKPLAGYEKAADPNFIRAPYRTGGGIRLIEDEEEEMMNADDRRRAAFVRNVQTKVSRLKPYQSDIIKTLYMGSEQLTDDEAYAKLYTSGYYVSDRYYDDEKAEAIKLLAEAFHIVRYKVDEDEEDEMMNADE